MLQMLMGSQHGLPRKVKSEDGKSKHSNRNQDQLKLDLQEKWRHLAMSGDRFNCHTRGTCELKGWLGVKGLVPKT